MEKCDNYATCKKYGIYGKCTHEESDELYLSTFCDVHQKQIITILSSIDDKLQAILEKK